jgi:hypothetical protein
VLAGHNLNAREQRRWVEMVRADDPRWLADLGGEGGDAQA